MILAGDLCNYHRLRMSWVLLCAAVCCSVLQCVAVCCSVLQPATVCCCMLKRVLKIVTDDDMCQIPVLS